MNPAIRSFFNAEKRYKQYYLRQKKMVTYSEGKRSISVPNSDYPHYLYTDDEVYFGDAVLHYVRAYGFQGLDWALQYIPNDWTLKQSAGFLGVLYEMRKAQERDFPPHTYIVMFVHDGEYRGETELTKDEYKALKYAMERTKSE